MTAAPTATPPDADEPPISRTSSRSRRSRRSRISPESRSLPGIRRRVPPVLHRRDFRRYWLGQSVSLVGDEIHRIALPLAAVLLFDAGAGAMAWLTAAPMVPALLLSIPAGVWADRRASRRRIMLAADLGRFAVVASIPVAYAFGVLTLAQLIISALIIGVFQVLFNVAANTLFAAMVPTGELVAASSLTNGSRAVAYSVGPSLGGVLVQLLRAPFALVADALSYLASALALSRIRPVEAAPEKHPQGGYLSGLRWVMKTPGMRATLGCAAWLNFFDFIFQALFVLYAVRHLHVGAGLLGVVLGAGAVGGILTATVTSRVVARLGIGASIVAGCVLFAAPHVLVPLAAGPRALVVLMLFAMEFLCGVGVMLLDITAGAYMTAVTPDAQRARVSGVMQTVNYGIRPVGALAGGWLASVVSIRDALWVSAVGSTFAVVFVLCSPLRRLRELPGAATTEAEAEAGADAAADAGPEAAADADPGADAGAGAG